MSALSGDIDIEEELARFQPPLRQEDNLPHKDTRFQGYNSTNYYFLFCHSVSLTFDLIYQ